MRSGLLLGFALIGVSTYVEAAPFRPDTISVEVLGARFAETGTDVVCIGCDDADPTNDFRARLFFEGFDRADKGFFMWNGAIDFTGTTSNDFSNIDELHIVVDLKVTLEWLWNGSPEDMAPYARPSVDYGSLTGVLFGLGRYYPGQANHHLMEECCDGDVHGIPFQEGFYPGSSFGLTGEYESYWHDMPLEVLGDYDEIYDYTPELAEVPEAATLLLVSTGLATQIRRRARNRGPQF